MILDENNNQITTASLRVAPDSNKDFTLRIECRDGYFLSAARENSDFEILAKANGSDAFQNIRTAPLSLTAYAGTTKTFYFRANAAADAADSDFLAEIIVSR